MDLMGFSSLIWRTYVTLTMVYDAYNDGVVILITIVYYGIV
jgi:hypothetical protein